MAAALGIIDSLLSNTEIAEKECYTDVTTDIPITKHFYENIDNLVFDAIDGELYGNPKLTRLYTRDRSIKVVYRKDWDKVNTNKVALISGGGSGHEPCFFGYVGKGMLTAAVCGEIFSSPTTKAIIHAILAVTNKDKGVLLLITNYTGDVLNFTLAAKIVSTSYNILCKILSLSDDIALPRCNIPNIGRRGLSGGVFIHKIAGYYAEKGYALDEIVAICTKYHDYTGTVGIAGSICHLIGNKCTQMEMDENILELGYGVHGEPGFETIKFDKIGNILPKMFHLFKDFSKDRNYLKFMQEHHNNNTSDEILKIVIMLNNLGGVTNMEMNIIKKYTLEYIYSGYLVKNIQIERVYIGEFETSMDMKGFSISIMKVDDNALTALDFDVDIKAWNKGEIFEVEALIKSNKDIKDGDIKEKEICIFDDDEETKERCNELGDVASNALKLCIAAVCKAIIRNKDILNELDKICGDGDCGTTLEFGAKLLLNNMDKFHYKCLSLTLRNIAQLLSDMGGSSGALYGFLFISASKEIGHISIPSGGSLDSMDICRAFKNAVFELSEYSKAKKGDRTMLDVLIPAIHKLLEMYQMNENDHKKAITECAKSADVACNETQGMIAKFGRSSYVAAQKQKKCVDPGAKAVAIWINSFVDVISDNL